MKILIHEEEHRKKIPIPIGKYQCALTTVTKSLMIKFLIHMQIHIIWTSKNLAELRGLEIGIRNSI